MEEAKEERLTGLTVHGRRRKRCGGKLVEEPTTMNEESKVGFSWEPYLILGFVPSAMRYRMTRKVQQE